jgi:hypothetical protein
MFKYYNQLRNSIKELGNDVPDILKGSYKDTMNAFLTRFLNRIERSKASIIGGIVTSAIIGTIGMPLLIAGIVLAFTTPLLLLSIILGSIGLVLTLIGTSIFLLTNNFVSYYKFGKNIGRLEERSKEMLQKFPQYKAKVEEIIHSKGPFTPKTNKITKNAFEAFKEKTPDEQQINMFLLEASNIFNNNSSTSTPVNGKINSNGTSETTSSDPEISSEYAPKRSLTPDNIIIPESLQDSNGNQELENLIN